MKNFFASLLLITATLISVAQAAPVIPITSLIPHKIPESGEFSSPVIQIGVVVSDLEKAVDFYTNVIGMTKAESFNVDGDKSKELGLSDRRTLDVTVLKLDDSEKATQLKLMSFGKKANHPKQTYIHDDTGVQYITIFVNNITPFTERIKKKNIKILSGEPSSLGNDNFFLLIQDPDGTFIELIGPKK
jgi:predicted enzyme related to lactoylglutathione lyase